MSEDIVSQFRVIVNDFSHEILEAVSEASEEAGRETANYLKANAKIRRHRRRGNYVDRFRVKIDKDALIRRAVVHNLDFRLTHLLENGHAISNGTGRKFGKTAPNPHWAAAEEYAKKVFEEKINEKIGKIQGG